MDNIKKTVSNFMKIKKFSSVESPTMEEPYAMVANEIALIKSKEDRGLPLNNPHREREILESIESVYYSEHGFDSSEFELKKLPEVPDVNKLKDGRTLMKEQLSVVTKKISDFILENYPSYSAELRKVTELQQSIKDAYGVCQNGRRRLGESESVLTVAGLNILSKYRKRQCLLNTFDALTRIKTLQETDMKLRELLEEDNMVSAIQLCLECHKAAEMYKEYTCISELTNKLCDTLVEIETHLDRILAANTLRLDLERYSRVIAAYEILNKTMVAADRIIVHFTSTVKTTAFSVVKEHCNFVEPSKKDLLFIELCKLVPADQFAICFQELLKLLWQILFSYHCLIWWHKDHKLVSSASVNHDSINDSFREKLEKHLTDLWSETATVIDEFVQSADLSFLKFDDFLKVVDSAHKFVEIGVRHFACESEFLQESLRQQSLKYFKSHHRACLDELRMFLETEEWKILPVPHHFGFKDLPEFSFVAKFSEIAATTNFVRQQTTESTASVGNGFDHDWKLMDPSYVNPFDTSLDDEENLSTFKATDRDGFADENSDDSDVADELKQDFVDDASSHDQHKTHSNSTFKRHHSYKSVDKLTPFVCNSSLNLLRLFGRYLHIANILAPISFDIITWLTQLFDYYFCAIFEFFTSSSSVFGVNLSNEKLDLALNRIRNNVGVMSATFFGDPNLAENRSSFCRLSPSVDLNHAETLYGVAERIVGVESLIFIANQLVNLKPVIEDLIPTTKKAFVQQFYAHTVNMAVELRRPVYGVVSAKSLNFEYFLNVISSTNWEITELMSQHNVYVDFILQVNFDNLTRFLTDDLDGFRIRLNDVCHRLHVPKETYEILWDSNIRMINRVLVEGFSYAKKCTHEGRALMQLDYQQFLLKLEKLMTLRPIPDKEFVENYIKAFYLPESSMEQWITERKEYSTKQIISLLHLASHISKKTRQRLISGLNQHDTDDGQ